MENKLYKYFSLNWLEYYYERLNVLENHEDAICASYNYYFNGK